MVSSRGNNTPPSPADIVARLEAHARPDQVEKMSRFGISPGSRLGVSIPHIRKLAREIGRDHQLALGLWGTGIQEARILAALVDVPEEVTGEQMDHWARDFDSWDVCDQVCMNLFDRVPLVGEKIVQWSREEGEFMKRAAFSLIAILAVHDKQAPDEGFIRLFPIIKAGAQDGRNYVKKAVSWALRSIGKRNLSLNRKARSVARELQKIESKGARWIAGDAIRELESEKIQVRLRERMGKNQPG